MCFHVSYAWIFVKYCRRFKMAAQIHGCIFGNIKADMIRFCAVFSRKCFGRLLCAEYRPNSYYMPGVTHINTQRAAMKSRICGEEYLLRLPRSTQVK